MEIGREKRKGRTRSEQDDNVFFFFLWKLSPDWLNVGTSIRKPDNDASLVWICVAANLLTALIINYYFLKEEKRSNFSKRRLLNVNI